MPIICQGLLRWLNGMQSRVIECMNWWEYHYSLSERTFLRNNNYWKGLVTTDDFESSNRSGCDCQYQKLVSEAVDKYCLRQLMLSA